MWLTNHAIESMAKRQITLPEIKTLIEEGDYKSGEGLNGWVYYNFPQRKDNSICAAVVLGQAVIIKTVMIHLQLKLR